jgi:hypothetical protein
VRQSEVTKLSSGRLFQSRKIVEYYVTKSRALTGLDRLGNSKEGKKVYELKNGISL